VTWEAPAALALAGGAIVALRLSLAWAYEQRIDHRFRRFPDGTIAGAEPIEIARGPVAVLILHGFGDTPQSVGALAQHLADAGWTVRVPLLPGHGRFLRSFARTNASDWLECARSEYRRLAANHRSIAVVGQSMGGALAALLAAEHPDMAALVLLAPYFVMPARVARLAHWPRLVATVSPFVRDRWSVSIWDPEARAKSLGFGVTPVRALRELARVADIGWAAVERIAVPTLMMHSAGDNRISMQDAERSFARLGAQEREFVRLTGCGHVITTDYCRAEVSERTAEWLRRHMAPE